MTLDRDKLLAFVARSPACVAAHDREGWLSLFSDDAAIEDPVGAPPAPKRDGTLQRFYDAFIAPNSIYFDVSADHTFSNATLRDATIHTRTPSGVTVAVEAYLEYRVVERDGALSVERMRAFWSLRKMVLFVLTSGPRAWWAMSALFVGMFRTLGTPWVLSYLASLWRTVGARGERAAHELAAALSKRDESALRWLFSQDASAERAGEIGRPEDLLASLPEGSKVTIEAPIVAGYCCAFRYRVEGDKPVRGIAILEFSPATSAIRSLVMSS